MNFSFGKLPRGFGDLIVASFCFALGSGLYNSTAANFLVQELSIQAPEMGLLETVREVPGLAMAGVAAATAAVPEPLLGAISLFVGALGVSGLFLVQSIPAATLAVFVWSFGLHGFLPISSSLTLSLAEEHSKGRRVGQIAGVTALGMLAAMTLVFLAAEAVGFRVLYLVAAGAVCLGAIALWRLPRPAVRLLKPRFVVRRSYSLYYVLTFLDGCRRQIFMTFAVFALVKVFGVSVQQIALLMMVSTALNLYAGPRVGRWIDAVGERRVLIIANAGVIAVFVGYAAIPSVPVLFLLYVVDSLLFTLSLALTTYLGRLAPAEDLTPSLSLGVTVNHLATVAMPFSGGLLWQAFGYQVPFLVGSGIALVALLVTFRMRDAPRPQAAASPA